MEDVYIHGSLTESRHFAVTDLLVGGVIWGDTKPGYNRAPTTDPNSAVTLRCLIDTGANWCAVSRQVVDDLSLITFDAPPPATLGPPKKGQGPVPATCITAVISGRALPAAAYISIPLVSDDRYDVVIGTTVLQYFRFTYDGPQEAFSLWPV
jgi:hypothetical protein